MADKPVHWALKAALEIGPIAAFLVVYLVYRDETFTFAGTEYAGFVAITALFIPVFILATGMLWLLTGQIARIQLAVVVLVAVVGVLGVWMNDPRLLKMKPTVIYLMLGGVLGIGLLRKEAWLKHVLGDLFTLKKRGWKILTKRVTLLFFVSAFANEVVWRTMSEEVWVVFETLVMPAVIFVFFIMQAGLFLDYGTLKPQKKRS